MAEAVRPVGGDVQVEHGVEGQHLAERLPGPALVEDEDAAGVLPHPELDRRAEHSGRLVTADGFHPEPLVHRRWSRSRRRVRHEVARLDVGRAGQHPDRPGNDAERGQRRGDDGPEIEIGELEVRRTLDRVDRDDARDHESLAADVDGTHLGAGVDERLDNRGDRRVEGCVVAQPAERELHGAGRSDGSSATGTRKRTSLS